jgi:hypothetical protein
VDTSALVDTLIEDGRKIVEHLPRGGFEVSAAFWLKPAEDGQWYFYVVSPVAESKPMNVAYAQLHTLIRQMPQPRWIDPLEVKLIGPSHPIARDILTIYNRAAGHPASPIRSAGQQLGNVSVDGTYLYPLPTAA